MGPALVGFWSPGGILTPEIAVVQPRRAVALRASKGVELRPTAGGPAQTLSTSGGEVSVGAGNQDIKIAGPNTFDPHAIVSYKNGRVFVTGKNSPDSRTFLGDVEIRANVAYMVAPGTKLSFGSCGENEFEVVFEELSADSPMMDMLMKGMARSDEVKKQLGQ